MGGVDLERTGSRRVITDIAETMARFSSGRSGRVVGGRAAWRLLIHEKRPRNVRFAPQSRHARFDGPRLITVNLNPQARERRNLDRNGTLGSSVDWGRPGGRTSQAFLMARSSRWRAFCSLWSIRTVALLS